MSVPLGRNMKSLYRSLIGLNYWSSCWKNKQFASKPDVFRRSRIPLTWNWTSLRCIYWRPQRERSWGIQDISLTWKEAIWFCWHRQRQSTVSWRTVTSPPSQGVQKDDFVLHWGKCHVIRTNAEENCLLGHSQLFNIFYFFFALSGKFGHLWHRQGRKNIRWRIPWYVN